MQAREKTWLSDAGALLARGSGLVNGYLYAVGYLDRRGGLRLAHWLWSPAS